MSYITLVQCFLFVYFLGAFWQFPIECSLPWMLVEHVLRSQDVGLLESILMPFDIYNDSADYALRVLKQRFLYDEIEAEVIHHLQKPVQNKCACHPHDQS
jgi:cytoplasmic FMR1 interacting protein